MKIEQDVLDGVSNLFIFYFFKFFLYSSSKNVFNLMIVGHKSRTLPIDD